MILCVNKSDQVTFLLGIFQLLPNILKIQSPFLACTTGYLATPPNIALTITLPFQYSTPATLAFLMFFKHPKHVSALETLQLLFPLSNIYSSFTLSHYWLSSFWSKLKYVHCPHYYYSHEIASLSFLIHLACFVFPQAHYIFLPLFISYLSPWNVNCENRAHCYIPGAYYMVGVQ